MNMLTVSGLAATPDRPHHPSASPDGKSPEDRLFEHLAGTQNRCLVVRLVRGVGTVLALDGHALIVKITAAALSARAAGQPVSGVHLNSGLGGQHFQLAAAFGGVQDRGRLKLPRLIARNQPAVIVSLSYLSASKSARMSVPIFLGSRKSIGVPATGSASPRGISDSSVGR